MNGCDIVICSGTLLSCMIAQKAAAAGKRVCLLTPRYSLGEDFSASMMPFLLDDGAQAPEMVRLFGLNKMEGAFVFGLGAMKRALLGAMDEAGVRVLFGRRAVRFEGTSALVSDKSGFFTLRSRALFEERREARAGGLMALECKNADEAAPGVDLVQGPDGMGYALFGCEAGVEPGIAAYEAAKALRARNEKFLPARRADGPSPMADGGIVKKGNGIFVENALPAPPKMSDAARLDALAAELAAQLCRLADENELGPELDVDFENLPLLARTGVFVAGAGTGGVPAAYGAAMQGAKTMICEPCGQLGGISTQGGVNVYFAAGDEYIRGFTTELDELTWQIEREISGNPPQRQRWNILARQLALEELLRRGGTGLLTGTAVVGALKDGKRIREAVLATKDGLARVRADAFIDMSGDGDLAAAAGVPFELGDTALGSLQTSNQCAWVYTSRLDGVNVDISVIDPTNADELDRSTRLAHAQNRGTDFSDFCASRESRRFMGAYRLTECDVLQSAAAPDAIVRSDGRFDQHALQSSPLARMGFLPYHHRVHTAYLPLRCCYGPDVSNLFFGGKLISAQRDAFSFFRMQQDIVNEGFALGTAAAMAPRGEAAGTDIAVLQKILKEKGILPEPLPGAAHTTQEAADLLHQNDPYGAALAICLGQDAIPALEGAAKNSGLGADWAKIALVYLGQTQYAPALLELIRKRAKAPRAQLIDREKRPLGGWHEGQCDDYWTVNAAITALSGQKSSEFLPLLGELIKDTDLGGPENPHVRLHWRRVPNYDRIVCLCMAAADYADPSLAPALEALLGKLGQNTTALRAAQNEYDRYPAAQLEYIAARAAAICGSGEGLSRLKAFEADARASLSRSAKIELGRNPH